MSSSRLTVAALAIAPVKGLRLQRVEHVEVGLRGVVGDRRFYLVDERGRMVNGKLTGALQQVSAEIDEELLTLAFPDGSRVSGEVVLGEPLESTFFSSDRTARLLEGSFAEALSEHAGRALRIVAPADASAAQDRGGERAAVSLLTRASIDELARAAGVPSVDGRRFRMNVEVEGASPFEEDGWVEREISVGEARVRFRGHVGRCLVTRRDPDTGTLDLETLELLARLRAGAATSEPLALGIYGAVTRAGSVRLGDPVRRTYAAY